MPRKKRGVNWLFGTFHGVLVLLCLVLAASAWLGIRMGDLSNYLLFGLACMAGFVMFISSRETAAPPGIPVVAPLLYIRISPTRIFVKNFQSGLILDEAAVIAVEISPGSPAEPPLPVHAIGHEAQGLPPSETLQLVSPFSAKASLFVKDSHAAAALIQHAFHATLPPQGAVQPDILIQWAGEPVPERIAASNKDALEKLGLACGRGDHQVRVVVNRTEFLSDEEVQQAFTDESKK